MSTEATTNSKDHWLVSLILLPGNWIINKFDIQNEDSRMLLRLYLNLTIYAKLFGTIAYMWVN